MASNETTREYSSVRDGGAGLIDLSASRSRIRVSGSEAVMFLNGLITNDIKNATDDSWLPAVFPTVQGRLIGVVRILRSDAGFLLDTESASHEAVLKTISRFTLAGDFKVTDVSNEIALLTVQGKRAVDVIQNVKASVVRATHTGEHGFDLLINTDDAESIIEKLIAAGAQPVGPEVFETLRIEAGIPRYGRDMDESNVVLEANLDDAISYTKGCYVGQEIIIRIKHRGHVAKKLTGLTFAKPVESGAAITSEDGKEIGRVTSATYSPKLETPIALGYVRYEYLSPGTAVKAGDISGKVTDLPIVRGSWYD
jgi:folate-binding protein YgfZ